MTGPEHYRAAELLLESCQLPNQQEEGGPEVYPGTEWTGDPDGREVNAVGNSLAAAQVHATLALAAATVDASTGKPGRLQMWGMAFRGEQAD